MTRHELPHYSARSSGRRFWSRLLLAIILLFCNALASAQTSPTWKREIALPSTPGEADSLVTVVAPSGRCAAVSEVAKVFAVAHKLGVAPHVSLFALDDKGTVKSAEAKTITLPCPAPLAQRKTYPLALAAHPTLPLLYVWQDIAAPAEKDPRDNPESDGFCHLLVYDIEGETPELLQSVASGAEYARGNTAGSIAFDFNVRRLFVPNLVHKIAKGESTPAIGFVRINEVGLVTSEAEDTLLAGVQRGASTDSKQKAQVTAAARKAYLNAVKTGTVESREIRQATSRSATFAGYPCGLSFFPVTEQITLVGGPLGPVTWDESNRRAQFNSVTIFPLVGAGYLLRLAGHPNLPIIYLSGLNSAWVYRIEHVDGFPTLLPQRGTLAGASIKSPPVVMASRRQLACGGVNTVFLVGLDDQGAFSGERRDIPVDCASVEAITYSARFDRLYVAVDKLKP